MVWPQPGHKPVMTYFHLEPQLHFWWNHLSKFKPTNLSKQNIYMIAKCRPFQSGLSSLIIYEKSVHCPGKYLLMKSFKILWLSSRIKCLIYRHNRLLRYLFYKYLWITESVYELIVLRRTHWGRDKIDAILQTTFSNANSWTKVSEFRLKFHWSLFLKIQLTIFQHWFR